MSKILVVGAGHSGLHLAHGLLDHGYDVTVITNQTSTGVRTRRPAITQLTPPTALEHEREHHLDFWSAQAPQMEDCKLLLYPSGADPIRITGRIGQPGQYAVSVDRRVKIADWLEYFEDRGGKVVIHRMTHTDLDYFSRMFDLVIIAVGGGELGELFDSETSRSSGARPRVVAQANIRNVAPDPESEAIAWAGATADAGNAILMPMLTPEGPCYSLSLGDKEGGPIDVWQDQPTPAEQLRRMKDLLRRYTPEFYERCKDSELVDGNSTLVEHLTPQVRNPVAALPSGGLALGTADVVVTMDPFGFQGWNNSIRCAESYLHSIIGHGDRPFTRETLVGMFEKFWEYGLPVQQFTEMISTMWDAELPKHFQDMIGAAVGSPEVANRWIAGWDYPPDYANWLLDPELARKFIAEVGET
ncbi:hypothetical protein F4561_006067 [Lipingzhangella halophila]|uniref:Styrene monooxygenase StyA putative substrate binding domain-containing protein n=1 Tax=Lipingzhangella halophila TaxID=1783352 RepID=A0A7W7W5X4_9ACTN|nr:styrene monooxygenase/indole monooxygenase family protein [Lipingzhangella halophila]MBB4935173.1 hypothetical protein [Lipingzhangella halophila]